VYSHGEKRGTASNAGKNVEGSFNLGKKKKVTAGRRRNKKEPLEGCFSVPRRNGNLEKWFKTARRSVRKIKGEWGKRGQSNMLTNRKKRNVTKTQSHRSRLEKKSQKPCGVKNGACNAVGRDL